MAVIEELSCDYKVSEICAALGISRSGYYDAQEAQSKPTARKQSDEQLLAVIRRCYHHNKKRYGSPRIWRDLYPEHRVSRKRVERLMRQDGLKARTKKRFRPKTTVRKKDEIIAPNLLLSRREPQKPNEVWVGDITYIPTREGFCYLAAVMDLCTRKVAGWALDDYMPTGLVADALKQAYLRQGPSPGLIFHSDRGCQYASRSYQDLLKSLKITPSMSAIGYCYDNAAMESLWSTYKTEALPEEGILATKAEAKPLTFEYFEVYYNQRRIHSALGYLTPNQVDFELTQKMKN